MLVIDGQLPGEAQREALEHYAAQRIHASIRQETLGAPSSRLAWDQKLT